MGGGMTYWLWSSDRFLARSRQEAGSAGRLLERHLHLADGRRLQRATGRGANGGRDAGGLPMLTQGVQSGLLQSDLRFAGRVVVGTLKEQMSLARCRNQKNLEVIKILVRNTQRKKR